MEQYGNTSTYNIETVLYQNVQNSEYFKNNCVKLSAIDELIDEVPLPSAPIVAPCLCIKSSCVASIKWMRARLER